MSVSSVDSGNSFLVAPFFPVESLLDEYESVLLNMVGEKNLSRVQEAVEDSFNPLLWKELQLLGPSRYHRIVHEEMLDRPLWAQADKTAGIVLQWATEDGWIHRAHQEAENVVILNSYISHILNIQSFRRELSSKEFQELITSHLSKSSGPEERTLQPPSARAFQRKLEQLLIVCKISKAAFERLEQLQTDHPHIDVSVSLGIYQEEGRISLMEISNYFFRKRLAFTNVSLGSAEALLAVVAPVIRSKEALNTAKTLLQGDVEFIDLDLERFVPRILKGGRNLKMLSAQLNLILEDGLPQSHEFLRINSNETPIKEFFSLSINFKGNNWQLKSQLSSKT